MQCIVVFLARQLFVRIGNPASCLLNGWLTAAMLSVRVEAVQHYIRIRESAGHQVTGNPIIHPEVRKW